MDRLRHESRHTEGLLRELITNPSLVSLHNPSPFLLQELLMADLSGAGSGGTGATGTASMSRTRFSGHSGEQDPA